MQQVLNSNERNEAFLKFLLFFVVTIIVVILAVFFNYHLPTSENRVLQEQLDLQRGQEATEAKFVQKMTEAVALLDSLDKNNSPANLEQINNQLGGKLTELELLRQKDDPSAYGRMNNTILDKLSQLQYAKSQVRDLQKVATQAAGVQQDLSACRSQLAADEARLASTTVH
jgi:hypothetical protein